MPRGYTEICKCGHPKKCHLKNSCGADSNYYKIGVGLGKECICDGFKDPLVKIYLLN